LEQLSESEYSYYSRQLRLPDWTMQIQAQLKASKVLLIGAGGLGCPAAIYLATSGIGQITIIDNDKIELSNLHRQILFDIDDVGSLKSEVAVKKLQKLNPFVQINGMSQRLDPANVMVILKNYDIVIDGSDNFQTRYLLNDACFFTQKILVQGAVSQYQGQLSVYNFPISSEERSANYRDLYPVPPLENTIPNCVEAGVSASVAGLIGTKMAMEAFKIISKTGTPLFNKLLIVDQLDDREYVINYGPNSANPLRNGQISAFTSELADYYLPECATECDIINELSPKQFEDYRKLEDQYQLIDVRSEDEHSEFNLGGENIPWKEGSLKLENIDINKIPVFYCQTGKRSFQAALFLKNLCKLNTIYHLKGGLNSWKYR
jgi:sulfur-carrier protein adenylyltransferase/sulfurtransferase